ncbi:MAG: DUF190 domain-containing protein, partial [Anaerolineae bacterium]|nr:DUF190 domain-containing protein [Anaerolineae bacterium]
MNDLSQFQTAQRLRLYFNESDRWMGSALSSVLLEKLKSSGLVGATLFRGQAGFGVHNRLHSTAIETLSMDLPLIIEVVDRPEKIQMALEIIMPMVQEGMY